MSLDPHPSDARVRELHAERTPRLNGVVLGPGSPVLPSPAPRAKPMSRHERAVRRGSGPNEHELQVEVFRWIDDPANQLAMPELALAFAVPNGGHRTAGAAIKLKAEGVRSGVPDIWLPARRRGYSGLVIEMKRPGGTTSPAQAHWLAALDRQGWKTSLHSTVVTAIAELRDYLALPR